MRRNTIEWSFPQTRPKDLLGKACSPQSKKTKSRPKLEGNCKRKKQSESKEESRCQTTNHSTQFTVNRKPKRKPKPAQLLSPQQIMNLINTYATKIQRQWLKYRMRVLLPSLLKNITGKKEPIPILRKELPSRCNYSSSEPSEDVPSYNYIKYGNPQFPATVKPRKENQFEAESENEQEEKSSRIRRQSKSFEQQKMSKEARRNSSALDNLAQFQRNERRASKNFQIVKEVEIKISEQGNGDSNCRRVLSDLKMTHCSRDYLEDKAVKQFPFQKALRKCKKVLQVNKLQKILLLESKLNSNQLTFRTYQSGVDSINQEHTQNLEDLRCKETNMKDNWNHLHNLYLRNIGDTRQLSQDSPKNPNSSFDISFEKWDFSQSAQKLFEGGIDFPASQSKKSIQNMLSELQACQEGRDAKGILQDCTFIKKQKQVQLIKNLCSSQDSLRSPTFKTEVLLQKYQNQLPTEKHNEDIFSPMIKIEEESLRELSSSEAKTPIKVLFRAEEVVDKKQAYLMQMGDISMESDHKTDVLQISPICLKNNEIESTSVMSVAQARRQIERFAEELQIFNSIRVVNNLSQMIRKAASSLLTKKSPPIGCDIDSINTWLLQICHYTLDNHHQELFANLVKIKQPPIKEVFKHFRHPNQPSRPYETISEGIFKKFEYIFIRSISCDMNVSAEDLPSFSTRVFTFHQGLLDALNHALMDELITGRRWILHPWRFQYRPNVFICDDYAKQSLEKAINVVSNWSEYALAKLGVKEEPTSSEWKQFHFEEQERLQLLAKEEVSEISLCSKGYQDWIKDQICLALGTHLAEECIFEVMRIGA